MVCLTAIQITNVRISAEERALKQSNEMLAKALSEPEKPVVEYEYEYGSSYSQTEPQPEPVKKAPRRRIIVDGKPLITPAE